MFARILFSRISLRHTFQAWIQGEAVQGGGGGGPHPPPHPWKIKYICFLAVLIRIPLKSQSYQGSIQCWAIIGTPTKRHFNGVSLAGRRWPANSCILIKINGPPLTKLSRSAHAFVFTTLTIRDWSMIYCPASRE